jgi:hypothetical protein
MDNIYVGVALIHLKNSFIPKASSLGSILKFFLDKPQPATNLTLKTLKASTSKHALK